MPVRGADRRPGAPEFRPSEARDDPTKAESPAPAADAGQQHRRLGPNDPGELRTSAAQPVNFHSRRHAGIRRFDPEARSEADGIEDMRAFIGHTAWKAAPTLHIEVDQLADQLMVSCYRDIPDIEIDPSRALSVGFHRYREEYLLTSLCLYGVSCWPEPHTMPDVQANDIMVARSLIGESASTAVAELLGGGSGTVALSTQEVAELTQGWRGFVARNTGEQHRS